MRTHIKVNRKHLVNGQQTDAEKLAQREGSGITANQGIQAGAAVAGMVGGAIDENAGKPTIGGGILKGAASGAAMGSVAGPWGAAIGGVVGGTVGGVSAKMKQDKIQAAIDKLEQDKKDAMYLEVSMNERAKMEQDQSMMKDGGIVTGQSGTDKVPAAIKAQSFVIPKEYTSHPAVKTMKMFFGAQKANKNSGSEKVMLTAGEYLIDPESVPIANEIARSHGLTSINDLAPNANDGKNRAYGGFIDPEGQDTIPATVIVRDTIDAIRPNNYRVNKSQVEKITNGEKTGKFIDHYDTLYFNDPGMWREGFKGQNIPPELAVDANGRVIVKPKIQKSTTQTPHPTMLSEDKPRGFDGGGLVGLFDKNKNLSNYYNSGKSMELFDRGTNKFKAPYYGKLKNDDGTYDWYRIADDGTPSRIDRNKEAKAYATLDKQYGNVAGTTYKAPASVTSAPATTQTTNGVQPEVSVNPDSRNGLYDMVKNATVTTGSRTADPVIKKDNTGAILGTAQAGMGLAGLMTSGNAPIESGMPEYNISPVIMNDVAKLTSRRDQGLDQAVKDSIEKSIESERQTDVGLAKEFAGGSNVTAFNRSILANTNAQTKRNAISVADQEQRDKNLSASMEGNKMFAGMQRTVFEDKYKNKMLSQDNWEKKQNAWAALLSSGIQNVIGSKQLENERQSNNRLREMIYGK
jgi:hypothetical protein